MNTSLHAISLAALLLLPNGLRAQGMPTPMPAPAPAPGAAPVVGAPGAIPGAIMPNPAATFAPGRMIEMRPTEKRPLLLKENERNPYAKRSEKEVEAAEEQANSEETRIREKLSTLKVTGSSLGPNGLRVLLGDIILEKGRALPQLLGDQSESLQVIDLTEDTVILGWIDATSGELTGKTVQVAYDLSPSVGYALQGQEIQRSSEGVASREMGVLRVGQERKKLEAGMATRPPQPNIPPEVFQAGQ